MSADPQSTATPDLDGEVDSAVDSAVDSVVGLDGGDPRGPHLWLRRTALGATVAVAGVWGAERSGLVLSAGKRTPAKPFVLRRREDSLRLLVTPRNLDVLRAKEGIFLARRTRQRGKSVGLRATPTLSFDLGPQCIGEEAVSIGGPYPDSPVGSRLAGSTRVVLAFPKGLERIPLTLTGLLNWSALRVVSAPPRGADELVGPTTGQTVVEMPWRLALSPIGRWVHPRALAAADRYEVWRTELRAPLFTVGEAPTAAHARPFWTDDLELYAAAENAPSNTSDQTAPGKPWREISLGPRDRIQIVTQSAQDPGSVTLSHLHLSALGGSIELQGSWPAETLTQWHHRVGWGREVAARTVRKGWLFPYGHRATLTTLTRRDFALDGAGRRKAFLVQEEFLTVNQAVRTFAGGDAEADAHAQGRDLPFTAVRCLTTTTPAFVAEDLGSGGVVPTVPGPAPRRPLELAFSGIDWIGREVGFTAPVVFMEDAISTAAARSDLRSDGSRRTARAENAQSVDALIARLQEAADGAPGHLNDLLREVGAPAMPGTPVAIAEATVEAGTDFLMTRAMFAAKAIDGLGDAAAPFLPLMSQAKGYLAQAAGLVSDAQQELSAAVESAVSYAEEFIADGFDAAGLPLDPDDLSNLKNPGEVFAKLEQAGLEMAKDTANGLLNGALEATGLSRSAGMVLGELEAIRKGNFTPESMLALLKGKLLGVIDVKDVFEAATGLSIPTDLPSVPDLGLPPPPEALTITHQRHPDRLETRLQWKPVIKRFDDVLVTYTEPGHTPPGKPTRRTRFDLDVRSVGFFKDPTASTVAVQAEITDVTLDLLAGPSFLIIDVRKITFRSGTGQKPMVDVLLGDVEFGEALSFVKELAAFVQSGGLGPTIDVDATGVTAAYGVAVPAIGFGIFSLSNLSIALGARIPFDDAPLEVSARFSSREDPFNLSVSGFGGGGWLAIQVGAGEVTALEVGLEFAGSLALNVGVASGGVKLAAGIYISYGLDAQGQSTAVLEGYLRLNGELSVLGIVTVSAEFYLGLTYLSLPGGESAARGRATLTVEVEVFCFSKSVSMEVEREISTGGGALAALGRRRSAARPAAAPAGPIFSDTMPPDEPGGSTSAAWTQYCNSFAAGGAR